MEKYDTTAKSNLHSWHQSVVWQCDRKCLEDKIEPNGTSVGVRGLAEEQEVTSGWSPLFPWEYYPSHLTGVSSPPSLAGGPLHREQKHGGWHVSIFSVIIEKR